MIQDIKALEKLEAKMAKEKKKEEEKIKREEEGLEELEEEEEEEEEEKYKIEEEYNNLIDNILYDLYDEFKYGESLGLINKVIHKNVKDLIFVSKRVNRNRGVNYSINTYIKNPYIKLGTKLRFKKSYEKFNLNKYLFFRRGKFSDKKIKIVDLVSVYFNFFYYVIRLSRGEIY